MVNPPRRRIQSAIRPRTPPEEVPGSGQSAESLARDIAAQPELLAAVAAQMNSSTPNDNNRNVRQRTVANIPGFNDLATTNMSAIDAAGGLQTDKTITFPLIHQSGDKKGKWVGKAAFATEVQFGENDAFKQLALDTVSVPARYLPAMKKWIVKTPTAYFANKMFEAMKASPLLLQTKAMMPTTLDTTIYDNPKIEKYEMTIYKSDFFEASKPSNCVTLVTRALTQCLVARRRPTNTACCRPAAR